MAEWVRGLTRGLKDHPILCLIKTPFYFSLHVKTLVRRLTSSEGRRWMLRGECSLLYSSYQSPSNGGGVVKRSNLRLPALCDIEYSGVLSGNHGLEDDVSCRVVVCKKEYFVYSRPTFIFIGGYYFITFLFFLICKRSF